MRRRVMPTALVLLALMLDTAVIPFVLESPYIVALTGVTVMALGVYLGRMHGMLYGMIGGLLTDILVGYLLGFNTFVYIALGFFAGMIAYQPPEVLATRSPLRTAIFRAMTFFGLSLAREIVIYGYQYFHTAQFESVYLLNILIRALLAALLGLLLGPLEARAVLGKPARYRQTSARQEVKFF